MSGERVLTSNCVQGEELKCLAKSEVAFKCFRRVLNG